MPLLHTNNLTGNDTTGTGSTGAPYKTIAKAVRVAVSDTEIRVAGGQWASISGTFTFTNSSPVVSTATSQVGIIAANDIITFEDGQYGYDKFHYRVASLTTTTITLSNCWTGPTQVVSTIFRINQAHYTATESWANPNIDYQPNGRTNIKITGGWNAGFVSNDNGWTLSRTTGFMISIPSGVGNGVGNWQNNLFFDKFISAPGGLLGLSNTTNSTNNSFAIGRWSSVMNTNATSNGLFNRNFGLYNLDENTPCEILVNNSANWLQYFGNAVAADNAVINPNPCNITLYASSGATTVFGFPGTVMFGTLNSGISGSKNKITMHLRRNIYLASNGYTPSEILGNRVTVINVSTYFQKLDLYCNANTAWNLNTPPGAYCQVEDIEFKGPFAESGRNGLRFGDIGQIYIDLVAEGKIIDSFKPCLGYSFGPGVDYQNVFLGAVSQANLSLTQVKDAEGLKTIDLLGNIYFKDTVNGYLRVSNVFYFDNYGTGDLNPLKSYKVIGVKEKLNAPFTVTFRLKDDGLGGGWNTIGVQYGPNTTQIIESTISLTTEFQDYYITIDPTLISDWNSFNYALYFGVASTIKNLNSNNNLLTYCFVESVTIS